MASAKLITAFVFAIRIVQSLFYLNPKFQASGHLLWLYSPVCVGPGRKPRKTAFLTTRLNFSKPQWAGDLCVFAFLILIFFIDQMQGVYLLSILKLPIAFFIFSQFDLGQEFVCLCLGLTSQSTIFQSCWDGATASWVLPVLSGSLAPGHNTAKVCFEPPNSCSGVRSSTTEPPHFPGSGMIFCFI